LDLVRYAESDGYKTDETRPAAWRYRDYVIDAFNADKPYDHFIAEQLAGDELWPDDSQALIATGFLRHWPYEDNGRDLDQQWASILNDVTDVTSQVFMGLTVGCARCHDHKYDPVLQRDYYRLQAFFAAMLPCNDLPVASKTEVETYSRQLQRWQQATENLRAERDRVQQPFHHAEEQAKGKVFPDWIQAMLKKPPAERTLYERQLVTLAGDLLRVEVKAMVGQMSDDVRKRWEELNAQIDEHDSLRPRELPLARGVRDVGPVAPPVTIPDDPSAGEIAPGFLSVLDSAPAEISPRASPGSSTGRRSALARWLSDPHNPFTARAMVNRIWQQRFGRGLVATSGDLGVQGDRPTHPELLDWLAAELVAQRWSVKALDRMIVTSSVYRQQSGTEPSHPGARIDPTNRLLWHMPPRRLEAEAMRDAMLTAAGEINLAMFGESVRPELPAGLTIRYAWKPTQQRDQQLRRSIYLIVKRNTQLPLLKEFDVPDNHASCPRRTQTTTPSQALMLFNDAWTLDRARALASRILNGTERNEADMVSDSFEVAYGRRPTEDELLASQAFLAREALLVTERLGRGESVALPERIPEGFPPARAAALVDFCHALLNSNEFLYVD
jgi:hypothetical protein